MKRICVGIVVGTVIAMSVMETKKKLMHLVKRGKSIIKNKVEEVLD